MRSILFALFFSMFLVVKLVAQESKTDLYKPSDNAMEIVESKIEEAGRSGKHVFLQIGGNWCGWCLRFNDFVKNDTRIDSLIKKNFLVYHVNYSGENKNLPLMTRLEYPQRFGFPVFVILDGTGRRLHTQNSAYLEEGRTYNREKVIEFLEDWSPSALLQYKSSR